MRLGRSKVLDVHLRGRKTQEIRENVWLQFGSVQVPRQSECLSHAMKYLELGSGVDDDIERSLMRKNPMA